jgi:hypothetical protein
MRIGRNPAPGDMSIREFVGFVFVLLIFPPLGLFLLLRYRVIQGVIAGYRERHVVAG